MTDMGPDEDEARLLGKGLADLRKAEGLTQGEAGERMGVSAQAWAKYELGQAPTIFRPDVQRRLAEALQATVDDLHEARDRARAKPRRRDEAAEHRGERGGRVIPFDPRPPAGMVAVYGMAAAKGDRLAIAEGAEIRYVPMHPAQRGYRRIGAAEIVGESMYPRWKPRELAYFVFDQVPPRGDDVIVELNDGTAMIKEYVGRTADNLMLREWNPAERVFDVPLSEVRALHAVVG